MNAPEYLTSDTQGSAYLVAQGYRPVAPDPLYLIPMPSCMNSLRKTRKKIRRGIATS